MGTEEAENCLEKLKNKRREKALSLWNRAKLKMTSIYPFTKTKEFRVFVYANNTEALAVMEMLAEINKWFYVEPVKG